MFTKNDAAHLAQYLGHVLAKSEVARDTITSHQQIVEHYDNDTLMHVMFQYHQNMRNSQRDYNPQHHADAIFKNLHDHADVPATSYAAPIETGMPTMIPPYSAKRGVKRTMSKGTMSPLLMINESALEIDIAAVFFMAPDVYMVFQQYLQQLDFGLRRFTVRRCWCGSHDVGSGVALTHTIRMMTNMLGAYTIIMADAVMEDMQYNHELPSAWQYPLFEQAMVGKYVEQQEEIAYILYETGMVHAPGILGYKAYSAALQQAIQYALSAVRQTVHA